MEYQFPENYGQLIWNDKIALVPLRVSMNCICDYKIFKAEMKLKYTFEEKESDLLTFIFVDDHTEMECFSLKKWDYFYDFKVSVEGTITVKELFKIPIEICLDYQNLIRENEEKDFTIVAQDQEIKVHKSILMHVSPVFARMLEESKWKESIEGKMEIAFLPFKLLKIAIDAFYGQKFSDILDPNEYIHLYQFAEQYDIAVLKVKIN
uniref:BTB domain-containing protein n=1 Tax=Panagrolaimus davidi TaxID=227884 RepID=A0A914PN79_9BILA